MPPLFTNRTENFEYLRNLRRQWLSLFNERLPRVQEEFTKIRQRIQLNEDGSFDAGDLALFDAEALALFAAARAYTDSLPGGG